MSIIHEARASDSSYVQSITRGHTVNAGATIRPAEIHWHMVITRYDGKVQVLIVGPWTTAGKVAWGGEAEMLWLKFKVGTHLARLPAKHFVDAETPLPDVSRQSMYLDGSAWQLPTYENADTFVERLVREGVLVQDTLVTAARHSQTLERSSRTLRHHFLHTTGLTQNHIRQVERAQQAAARLRQGDAILDIVYELGYFDQPHLTRSLKQFIGYTPAQLSRMWQPNGVVRVLEEA